MLTTGSNITHYFQAVNNIYYFFINKLFFLCETCYKSPKKKQEIQSPAFLFIEVSYISASYAALMASISSVV